MECPAPAPTGQGQPFQATVQRARRAPRAPPARAPRPASRPRSPAPSCTVSCAAAASGAHPPAAWGLRLRQPLRPTGLRRLLRLSRPGLRLRLGASLAPAPACARAGSSPRRAALPKRAVRYAGHTATWLPTARGRACHRGEGEWPIERSWPSPRRGGRAPAPARDCNGRAGGIQPVPPCVQATNCSSPPTSNPSTCIRSAVRIGTPR